MVMPAGQIGVLSILLGARDLAVRQWRRPAACQERPAQSVLNLNVNPILGCLVWRSWDAG
jgi:hypothetical protein